MLMPNAYTCAQRTTTTLQAILFSHTYLHTYILIHIHTYMHTYTGKKIYYLGIENILQRFDFKKRVEAMLKNMLTRHQTACVSYFCMYLCTFTWKNILTRHQTACVSTKAIFVCICARLHGVRKTNVCMDSESQTFAWIQKDKRLHGVRKTNVCMESERQTFAWSQKVKRLHGVRKSNVCMESERQTFAWIQKDIQDVLLLLAK